MISTVEELERYTETEAAEAPELADEVLLRTPGLSSADLLLLKRELPGLPTSYVDCAIRFALESVILGYVGLRPRSFGGEIGLLSRLLVANSPANPTYDLLRKHDAYEVAFLEGDPICVRSEGPPAGQAGEVLWVDVTSHATPSVRPLANDFSTFMVMTGRLYQGSRVGADIADVLGVIPLSSQQAASWRSIAAMVLE